MTDPIPVEFEDMPSGKTPEEQDAENQLEWEKLDAAEQAVKFHALFSNRIFAQPDGQHLRITFGERVDSESVYHTAIVVPNADALQFGHLLVRMAEASLENQIEYYRQVIAHVDGTAEQEPGVGEG